MEGYHIQQLQQEREQLKQERAVLNVAEAQLLSQDNLNKMAARLNLVDPAPQQVQFLEGTVRHEARNRMPSSFGEVAR
jgi:hypothetical protein